MSWCFVDADDKILPLKEDLKRTAVIAIDTEYDSYHYFDPRLCLIQIRCHKNTYILDPLGRIDFSFLAPFFSSPLIVKVFHAGDNDLRLLRRDFCFEFRNIFDVQKAAQLLGYNQLSLSYLVRTFLGVTLEKSSKIQRSRWDVRPLSDTQLRYAISDTAYLVELYEKLADEIRRKGLEMELARRCNNLKGANWHKDPFKEKGYLKLIRDYKLSREEENRLRRLFLWRYEKAKETNRAVFMILTDQEMLHLALFRGQVCDFLSQYLSVDKSARYGLELRQLLEEGS